MLLGMIGGVEYGGPAEAMKAVLIIMQYRADPAQWDDIIDIAVEGDPAVQAMADQAAGSFRAYRDEEKKAK